MFEYLLYNEYAKSAKKYQTYQVTNVTRVLTLTFQQALPRSPNLTCMSHATFAGLDSFFEPFFLDKSIPKLTRAYTSFDA